MHEVFTAPPPCGVPRGAGAQPVPPRTAGFQPATRSAEVRSARGHELYTPPEKPVRRFQTPSHRLLPILRRGTDFRATHRTNRAPVFLITTLVLLTPAILPAQDIVEGGSPLYGRAVKESIDGLVKREKTRTTPAAAQPCKHCGKIHPPGQHGTPRPAAHASTPGKPCPKCGKIHAPAETQAKPAAANHVDSGARLPPEMAGKYYYCKTCKKYHVRKQTPPGETAVRPAKEETIAAKRDEVLPPKHAPAETAATNHVDSGAILSPHIAKEYYYCRTCKKYHSRKEIPPTSAGASDTTKLKARAQPKPE